MVRLESSPEVVGQFQPGELAHQCGQDRLALGLCQIGSLVEVLHYCMFFVGTSCKRCGPQLVSGELVAKFLRGLKQMAF